MKPGFEIGASHTFVYRVLEDKTVPHIYREAPELADFPKVFATGFMVALMEWACVQALAPYLEPGEGSLGVRIDVGHLAAHAARIRRDRHLHAASDRQAAADLVGLGTRRPGLDR